MTVDPAARNVLLRLARAALEVAVGAADALPVLDAPVLHETRGAFVTLKKRGALRGCVGRVEPDAPLSVMLPVVARLSALSDPRFPPVAADELPALRIEVSLLTPPCRIDDPLEVVAGRDGVVVSARGRKGLLLPQVATEYRWSNVELLSHACEKAGLPAGAWRTGGVSVSVFQADVFAEAD